jgi:hypothetical protein
VRLFDRAGLLLLPAAVCIAVGCSDNESPPQEPHTPATYNLIINDVPQTAPYVLTVGQTALVRIKLFNAAGDDLDDVEAEHFAGLTFEPTSLAAVTRVADHHYQFNVTAPATGSGTLQVSFGHDEMADEKSFPSAEVSVMGSAGPVSNAP